MKVAGATEATGEEADWSRETLLIEEMNKTPVGGRLKLTADKWRGIGASNKVCRWLLSFAVHVRGGVASPVVVFNFISDRSYAQLCTGLKEV